MQKLLIAAPAAVGLAASLLGATQYRVANASETGRPLAAGEMKRTQGKGYACNVFVCQAPEGSLSCKNNEPVTGDSTEYTYWGGKICGPAAQGTCTNQYSSNCIQWITFDGLDCPSSGPFLDQSDPDPRSKCTS